MIWQSLLWMNVFMSKPIWFYRIILRFFDPWKESRPSLGRCGKTAKVILNWVQQIRHILISTFDNFQERIVTKCLENRVALYSPHTAFDAVQDGVNDWLISPFGKWRFMEYFNIDVKFSVCHVFRILQILFYWFQFFKFVFLFLPHLPNVTISIIITQPFEFL